jgi:hypothetical protein
LTQQIDLKAIIKGANPGIARLVPDFLIRLLNRITHLREVNHILSRHGKKRGLEFIQAVLEYFQISTNFRGEKQLVGLSRPVIASNHPLGGMDGMILIGAVGRWYPGVKALANDLLLNLESLRETFIPVNKHGSNKKNLERYHQAYEKEEALVHFPAGLCSRKKAGLVKDLPWEKSFIRLAKKYHRPIVPTFFSGVNTDFLLQLG